MNGASLDNNGEGDNMVLRLRSYSPSIAGSKYPKAVGGGGRTGDGGVYINHEGPTANVDVGYVDADEVKVDDEGADQPMIVVVPDGVSSSSVDRRFVPASSKVYKSSNTKRKGKVMKRGAIERFLVRDVNSVEIRNDSEGMIRAAARAPRGGIG